MKKLFKLSLLSSLLLPLLLVIICAAAIAGDSSNTSSNGSSTGTRTTLTAKEVAQKASITEERAEDVIKILNYQLSKEGFTLAGSTGSIAVAERESGFDPKAINTGGGVAGYFQWSGWSNTVNGDRWAQASSRTLDADVELQLMSTELNGAYKKVKTEMQKATDPGMQLCIGQNIMKVLHSQTVRPRLRSSKRMLTSGLRCLMEQSPPTPLLLSQEIQGLLLELLLLPLTYRQNTLENSNMEFLVRTRSQLRETIPIQLDNVPGMFAIA